MKPASLEHGRPSANPAAARPAAAGIRPRNAGRLVILRWHGRWPERRPPCRSASRRTAPRCPRASGGPGRPPRPRPEPPGPAPGRCGRSGCPARPSTRAGTCSDSACSGRQLLSERGRDPAPQCPAARPGRMCSASRHRLGRRRRLGRLPRSERPRDPPFREIPAWDRRCRVRDYGRQSPALSGTSIIMILARGGYSIISCPWTHPRWRHRLR